MASSPALITPTTKPASLPIIRSRLSSPSASANNAEPGRPRRRDILPLCAAVLSAPLLHLSAAAAPAYAASEEEYVKETEEVISKVRTTITLDKNDPNVATAVAELRETSNSWVAKYRREKALLGRASFRDIYSALNAVSGHYISFGPTAPIPAKRRARILEEMDTAEKALLRGR
ncbi:hypothetical protein MLD38_025846 [Melastoma candidum]|uniref:Uncharacterized protein n=1 Tax=Melastoma candidum TaxID=119954 RepID=A0ACB9NY94_9MYRT|nr:hypothetical protein MLD38_025846 [Melastoma candidum]